MDFELKVVTPEPISRQIERLLRQQIQKAQGDASFRLSSTKELAKKWKVSCTAIDQAMAPLVAEGLLERHRKRGTFIKGNTQQAVIGIVFGSNLSDEMAHFLRALRDILVAETGKLGHNWTTRVYDGLYGLLGDAAFSGSPVCRNLAMDLSNYSFKGIVLVSREPSLLTLLKPDLDLPTVRLGPFVEKLPDAVMDLADFGRDAIGHFARKGIRRIAYLRTFAPISSLRADLDAMASAAHAFSLPEVDVHEIWKRAGDRSQVEASAFEATSELVQAWSRHGWPEAIVVSDDVAMRGVAMALMRNGVTVPEGLELMTLANEGICHHYGIPVTKYEFSPYKVAKALLDILCRRIEGSPLPELPVRISGRIGGSSSRPLPDSGLMISNSDHMI